MSIDKLTSSYGKRLLFISIALILGGIIGVQYDGFASWVDSGNIGVESIFVKLFFIIILFTPFARVKYEKIKFIRGRIKSTITLLLLNWILGPLALFLIAYYLFQDEPQYIVGLVLVSIARSKSDILYLNKTFIYDMDFTDGVVALNSLVQLFSYALLTWVFLYYIPISIDGKPLIAISYTQISEKVAIYIGIPLVLGLFTRLILSKSFSQQWYDKVFIKHASAISFFGVVILCFCLISLKIEDMQSLMVCFYRMALPLFIYFALQYFISFTFKSYAKKKKKDVSSLVLTGIIHNFRLAFILSITLFGINSLVAEVVAIATLIEFLIIVGFTKILQYIYSKREEDSRKNIAM